MFLFSFLLIYVFRFSCAKFDCPPPNKCMSATECYFLHERAGVKIAGGLDCNDIRYICCQPFADGSIQGTTTDNSISDIGARIFNASEEVTCGQRPGYDDDEDRVNHKMFRSKHAKLAQFPWIVHIDVYGSNSYLGSCGGTLISEMDVLSAAHCFPKNTDRIEVKLGAVALDVTRKCDENSICIPVIREAKALPHTVSKTPSKKMHDIALLQLNESVPFNDYIQPACLPTDSTDYADFEKEPELLLTAGWGTTDEGRENSNSLMWARQTVYNLDQCREIYKKVKAKDRVSNNEMCSLGKKKARGMSGDSGGPLLARQDLNEIPSYVVVGIFSRGADVFRELRIPVVYTNVKSYLNWIKKNMLINT